jgi:hypothetical protein
MQINLEILNAKYFELKISVMIKHKTQQNEIHTAQKYTNHKHTLRTTEILVIRFQNSTISVTTEYEVQQFHII